MQSGEGKVVQQRGADTAKNAPPLPCPALSCPPREKAESFIDWGRPKAASAFLAQDAAECQPRFHSNPESIMRGHSHHFAWKHVRRARGVNVLGALGLAAACSLSSFLVSGHDTTVADLRALHCTVRTAQQQQQRR
jgi:hypothetical protein